MSTIPFVSVDMPATSASGSGSSAPTGQEGIFANHLATASAKQGTSVPSAASANKTSASPKTSTPEVAEAAETVDAVQPSQTSADNTIASTDPAISPEGDAPAEDTTPASADGVAIDQALLYFTWAAATDLNAAPTIIQTLDNSTAVDRMLGAISASSAASTAVQTTMVATAKQAAGLSPESSQPTAASEPSLSPSGQDQITTGEAVSTAPQSTLQQERTAGPATNPSAQAPETGAAIAAMSTAETAKTAAQVTVQSTTPTAEQSTATPTGNTASTQATSQSVALQQNATRQGFSQIGQGEYTQIINVHQSNLKQESTSASSTESTAGATVTTSDTISGTRQDTNQNAIQAKLPKDVGATEQGQANTQQQDDLNGQQKNSTATEQTLAQPQTETLLAQKPQIILNQDGQPLIFANAREAATPLVPGSTVTTPTADSTMLRLPSGLVVPEGTVIEQMITRLSVNQRLETGTVNLRLYPQELGELRMEIKIEQDNIKAHIITQNPQAQEMIDRHIPRLREALEQQGLHLQQVEVTIAANDNGNDHRYQDNSRQQQMNRSMQSSITQPVIRIEPTELTPEPEYNNASNLSILA